MNKLKHYWWSLCFPFLCFVVLLLKHFFNQFKMPNEDEDEDNWEDISACIPQKTFSVSLTMAGGGAHAWDYILKWTGENVDKPIIFVWRYPFNQADKEIQYGKTLVYRSNDDRTEEVLLVDDDYELKNDHEMFMSKEMFFN